MDDRMRILYLASFFRPYSMGGAEVSTELFARKLARENKVFVLTPNYGSFRKKIKKEGGLTVYRFPFPVKFRKGIIGFLENIFFVTYLLFWTVLISKKYKIQVIHIQNDSFVPGGGFAAMLLKKPYMITVRDHGFLCNLSSRLGKDDSRLSYSHRIYSRLHGKGKMLFPIVLPVYYLNLRLRLFSFRRSTRLVCVSKYMSKRVTKDLNLGENRVKTVYNIKTETPKIKPKTGKGKIFLYLGRLCRPKGVDLLLEGMKEIVKKYPEWKLWLVGNTSVDHYRKLAEDLGIEKNVEFFGWQPYEKIIEFYERSFAVIMPSLGEESLSRVLIEAGSLGKPVIATCRGGSGEVVIDKNTGVLIRDITPQGLAKGMEYIIRNPGKAREMGKNIKKLAGNLFDSERNLKMLSKIYRELL
jgi:glycosyltransferase involved in cell wall biosynthesis